MCGIVGVFGNVNENEKKAFRDMLLMDVIRGQDSTGVLHIPTSVNVKPQIYKDLGHPCNLWDPFSPYKSNLAAFSDRGVFKAMTKGLLGHNRAATVGKVNVESAHPFNFGDVYGVHNGTLYSTHSLEGDHEVDSMCIYDTINQKGIDHTWNHLFGAAALVWWDEKENLLNIVRNDDRPLYYCYNKKADAMFIASEPWMIRAAMGRNKISPEEDKNSLAIGPKPFVANRLYQFKLSTLDIEFTEDRELKKWTTPVTGTSSTVGFSATGMTQNLKNSQTGVTSTPRIEIPPKPRTSTALINSGWATGLPKLDKEVKDMEVSLRFPISCWNKDQGGWNFWLVGEGPNKEKVHIFPSRMGFYEKWETAIRNASADNKNIVVRLNCRPRYSGVLDSNNCIIKVAGDKLALVKKVASTSSQTVSTTKVPEPLKAHEPALYPIYQGLKVPQDGFYKALRAAGDCCCNCGTVINHEDSSDIEWLGKFHVACKDCKEDPNLQHVVGGLF